jgi:FAD-linked sulfhydryl oxidase
VIIVKKTKEIGKMDTKIWGPSFWQSLHLLSLAYPEAPSQVDMDSHKQFLYSLARVLPCPICRQHFLSYLSEVDLDIILKNKDSFVRFIFSVHNDVNKRLDKPQWTYEQFYEYYSAILASGTSPCAQKSGFSSSGGPGDSFVDWLKSFPWPAIIVVFLLIMALVITLKYTSFLSGLKKYTKSFEISPRSWESSAPSFSNVKFVTTSGGGGGERSLGKMDVKFSPYKAKKAHSIKGKRL